MMDILNFLMLMAIITYLFADRHNLRFEKRAGKYYITYTKEVWDELTRSFENINHRIKLW